LGFEIHNKTVIVNHSHNLFSNTNPSRLPKKVTTSNGLTIYCLFPRLSPFGKKKGRGKNLDGGDNSPLIYALKGKDNLRTTISTIKELRRNSVKLLELFTKDRPPFDIIVPIPSGHNICLILAKRVSRAYGNTTIVSNLVKKRTLEEALDLLNSLETKTTPAKIINLLRDNVKRQIKSSSRANHLAIKHIPTNYRRHLPPVKLNRSAVPRCTGPQRILLIDDQVSSASTLMAAKDTLQDYYPRAEIEALALFGPLHEKLRK
jgi:hypothetical protein